MSALKEQKGGDHYLKMKVQPAQFIAANNWDFFHGCVFKYIARHRTKNGKVDLEKAIHFLQLRSELYDEQGRALSELLNDTWMLERNPHLSPLRPAFTAYDYLYANEIPPSDRTYAALLMVEDLHNCDPDKYLEWANKIITYLNLIIDSEYPIDNSTKG